MEPVSSGTFLFIYGKDIPGSVAIIHKIVGNSKSNEDMVEMFESMENVEIMFGFSGNILLAMASNNVPAMYPIEKVEALDTGIYVLLRNRLTHMIEFKKWSPTVNPSITLEDLVEYHANDSEYELGFILEGDIFYKGRTLLKNEAQRNQRPDGEALH